MPASSPTRSQLIASAQSEADLMLTAASADPALSAALMRAQSAALSPIGAVIAGGIAAEAAKYGLPNDPNLVAVIAGAAVIAGGYAVHWFQGRFSSAKVAAARQAATTKPLS